MIRFIKSLIERRKAEVELRKKLAFTQRFNAKAVARGMARTMDHHRTLIKQ